MFKNELKNNDLLKLNLQFFAEEDPTPDDDPKPNDDPAEKLELTEEELNKKVESESDRKLQSALKKEREKIRAEMEQELENQKEEAERLAKLSAKERQEAEFEKRQQKLDKREKELAQKELKSQAITELQEKELPSTFADFLLSDNGEKTFENINNFKETFDEAVNTAVKEQLRQDPPESGNGSITNHKKQPSKAEMARKNRII